MHNAGRVRHGDRIRDLDCVIQTLDKGQSPVPHDILQSLPGDIFHGDEMHAVRFVDIVNNYNARVIECGSRFGFKDEPAPAFRIRNFRLRQDLYRNESVQVQISRLVDDSHTALADLFQNLIVQKRVSDHKTIPRYPAMATDQELKNTSEA